MPLTKAEARKIALSIPGTEEKPHYGKPAVFLGEHFLTRVHDKEDAVVLPVGSTEMRDVMLEAEPELFYITDHYRTWGGLLARLARLDRKTLTALLKVRVAEIEAMPAKKRWKRRPRRMKAKP